MNKFYISFVFIFLFLCAPTVTYSQTAGDDTVVIEDSVQEPSSFSSSRTPEIEQELTQQAPSSFSLPQIPDTVDFFTPPDISSGIGNFVDLLEGIQNQPKNPLRDSQTGDRGVYMRTVPNVPGPREDFYVQIISGFENVLNLDQIRWFVDDKQVFPRESIALINLVSKNVGEPTKIRAEIFDDVLGFVSLESIVLPMLVDILSEGIGITPNWYLGGNLPAYHSSAKLTAIVDYIDLSGKRYRNEDFIFEWRENHFSIDPPRRGANTFITLPLVNPGKARKVELWVSPANNTLTFKTSVFVEGFTPNVYIYENDPVYGIINERVIADSVEINKNQKITITAIPYFFDKGENQGHAFDWLLDGRKTDIKSNSIILESPENTSVYKNTNLLLKAKNPNPSNVLQYDEYEISVNF